MPQGNPAPVFGVFSGVVDHAVSGTLHAGSPVYTEASGFLNKAADGTATTASCAGLTRQASARDEVVPVQYAGPLQLTVEQWNLTIEDEGADGLEIGATYYVGANAGKLTHNKPGSNPQQVGIASSQTTLVLNLSGPFKVN